MSIHDAVGSNGGPPSGQPITVAAVVAVAQAPPFINWKFGIRLPGRMLYLDVRIGSEQRSPKRLRLDGQVLLPVAAALYATAGIALCSLFGLLCFLYLLKSMAGINLFAGNSPLHPIYALFFE